MSNIINKVFTMNFVWIFANFWIVTYILSFCLCELIWRRQQIETKPETAVGFSVNPIWSVPSFLMDYDCYPFTFRVLKRECREQHWPRAHLHQRRLTYADLSLQVPLSFIFIYLWLRPVLRPPTSFPCQRSLSCHA